MSIEISREGMNTLRRYHWRSDGDKSDRVAASATVREGDTVFTNVAIHTKGSSGSFRPIDSKPALTLNFDRFADGQKHRRGIIYDFQQSHLSILTRNQRNQKTNSFLPILSQILRCFFLAPLSTSKLKYLKMKCLFSA